jgi:hypothetical protein
MSHDRKSRHWREHLNPDEVEALAALEQEARTIDQRRREISRELQLIRQRGGQRYVASMARRAA